ncbi:MAG: right-handed parallel beta-helix repeat-containing protein [Actinomycetota bacterium]
MRFPMGIMAAAALAGTAAFTVAPAGAQMVVHRGTVAVDTEFRHFIMPVAPSFFTRWQGEWDLTLVQETFGSVLLLPLGLGDRACRVVSAWSLPRQPNGIAPTTGTVEMCITASGTSASQMNAWIHGQAAPDPALRIQMAPSGPSTWMNVAPVSATLFTRDCRLDPSSPLGIVDSALRRAQARVESTMQVVRGVAPLPPTGNIVPQASAVSTRPTKSFVQFGEFTMPAGSLTVTVAPTGSIGLVAASGAVSSTDPTVWGQIRAECGNAHLALPDNPRTGTFSNVSAPPAQSDRPGTTGRIRGTLVRAAEDSLLARADAAVLAEELDQADDRLALARPLVAIDDLEQFITKVDVMVGQGRMTTVTGSELRASAQETILALVNRTRPPSERPEDPPSGLCPVEPRFQDYTEYHVGTAVGGKLFVPPDGSPARPFPTIGDALARAEEIRAIGVKVLVEPGSYRENLVIHRNTRIFGDGGTVHLGGRVKNQSSSRLELDDVDVVRADAPGAIVVDHPCAHTVLNNVDVVDADLYGIWQRNGRLRYSNGFVTDTQAGVELPSQGTGIYLTGGVRADLGNINLYDNTSGGLIAQGVGTAVIAENLVLRGNSVNPFYLSADGPCLFDRGGGGVLVRFGAHMTLSDSSIADTAFLGAAAYSEGTILTILDSRIDDTTQVGDCGGFSVSALDDGYVRLEDVTLIGSDRCGLMIATGGTADYHIGYVSEHPIGACVQTEGFDVLRLQSRVVYDDNERQLDSTTLPVPEDLDDL